MDAGAVAGLAVGVDRTAVPDVAQRLDALGHDLAARLAVDGDDAADAAGVAAQLQVVEPGGTQPLDIAGIGGDEGFAGLDGLAHRRLFPNAADQEASARRGASAAALLIR